MTNIIVLAKLIRKYKQILKYAEGHNFKETKDYLINYHDNKNGGMCKFLGKIFEKEPGMGEVLHLLYHNTANPGSIFNMYGSFWFKIPAGSTSQRQYINQGIKPRLRLLILTHQILKHANKNIN